MAQTVIGIFKNSTEAQNAKQHLLSKGFTDEIVDISSRSGTEMPERNIEDRHDEDFGDKISRFFNNLFGDEDESSRYSKAASHGTTVTVHAQSSEQAEMAADILDDYGAVDVDEYAAAGYGASTTGRTANMGTSEAERMGGMNSGRVGMDTALSNRDVDSDRSTPVDRDTDRINDREETSIPIIEENLNVGKKDVITGGKRLHSRIVERPVEETVRLREEHVNIERKPADRAATEQDITNFKEGTIEVTEHAEIPVVDKEARVVEDVNLYKDVDEKQEVIRETLRNTEVETDEIKARNQNIDEEDTDKAEHHRDDPHHQRPGIV
jgi:stress response protein YsnF